MHKTRSIIFASRISGALFHDGQKGSCHDIPLWEKLPCDLFEWVIDSSWMLCMQWTCVIVVIPKICATCCVDDEVVHVWHIGHDKAVMINVDICPNVWSMNSSELPISVKINVTSHLAQEWSLFVLLTASLVGFAVSTVTNTTFQYVSVSSFRGGNSGAIHGFIFKVGLQSRQKQRTSFWWY